MYDTPSTTARVSVENDGLISLILLKVQSIPLGKLRGSEGQKGTIGMTYKQEDMPYTKDGIVPDIIMNPNAIPKRMTIAQFIECVFGKVGTLAGCELDATPFRKTNVEEIAPILESMGYSGAGTEILYNGKTGEQIEAAIFMGPTFYYRLKHLVEDKLHCLDYETEILTKCGWKKHNDLQMTDEVATLKDNKLIYEKPIEIYNYPDHVGDMYHIKNQSIDLHVTSEHRMWVSSDDKNYDFKYAKDLVNEKVYYKKNISNINEYKDDQHIQYFKENNVIVNHDNVLINKNVSCPVWCVHVPSEVFYVRRNGKACWTGNSRATGPYQLLTMQPAEGRSRDGGFRFGEMERDCMLSHGSVQFLKERTFDCSDKYYVWIDKETGMISPVNPDKNIYKSLYSDNTTKFAKVQIPYSSKLFFQELQAMHINSRILTK